MGGGLDLRALVVAASVNGEHFGAIDNANLVRIGKHREHAPRHREQRGQPPQVDLVLPEHVQRRHAPVRPHSLETYDQLKERSDD
jgi:hypothetical protein